MTTARFQFLSSRSRIAALGTAIALGAVFLVATPAHAADIIVSDEAELTTALANGVPVALGASISVNASTLPVTASTTLDLAGFDLYSYTMSIAGGVSLTIDDSVGGGLLHAEANSDHPGIQVADSGTLIIEGGEISAQGPSKGGSLTPSSAGIGGASHGNGGTIIINGGTVSAYTEGFGAGIGGGAFGDSASITINGGDVHATSEAGAGIGSGNIGVGSLVTITGGTVTAVGGFRGAGIGGGGPDYHGDRGDGGTVIITGGTVTATGGSVGGAGIGSGGMGTYASPGGNAVIEITGGTVRAVGGNGPLGGGAGIGTGLWAGSSKVTIGPDAVVSAKGGVHASAVGLGAVAAPLGYSMVIDGLVTVDAGSAIYVPNGKFLRGTGLINGQGLIYNDGTILADAGPGWTIERRNYLVTFDANYPSASPASEDVRVLSNQMLRGEREIPTVQRAGWVFDSWNTAADGTGSTFTTATGLTAPVTVYAQWVQIHHLAITPVAPSLTAGDTRAFAVTAFGPGAADALGDFTDRVTFSSSNPDDEVTVDSILFREAGDRRVTAKLSTDPAVEVSTMVGVAPGPVDSIELTLSATTVEQGGQVTAKIVGFDAFGNETGDLTSVAGLTSDHPGDVVDGAQVTFPHASPHIITATFDTGGVVYRDSVTVEVVAAASGLAATGTDAVPLAFGALLLLVLGGTLLYRRRRA